MQRGALPPLSTLQAFEAAGRLMSFTRAAEELNVTQAAVSKQIRALEHHVGQNLFERSHRAVQLTAQGREYLHTVVTALNHLAHATLELRSDEAPLRLCIAADHSVAALWLLPRMTSLQAAMPDVTFHLVVSDAESRSLADEVDVAILHGEDGWPLHQAEALFPEIVFPVCSPAYLAGAPPIRHMADLAAARLIDLEDDNWTWINWRIWLTNHGVGLPATHKALTIGNYPLVLEAARKGLGVALAWQSLIEDDLDMGRLVRPVQAEVRTRFSYYLAWPRTRQRSAIALAFCNWVHQQFGKSRL
jgi:LysR family transcriptional regulator, glycine cleavage system transcriptional activator